MLSQTEHCEATALWRFTPKMKAEKTRNPVTGEFFAQDAIRNAGEALVREAIQNAIDARLDRQNGKARVRIYISGPTTALKPEAHGKWFRTAWEHYLAPKNGLRPGMISPSHKCSYLVFEDFGTSGLTGAWDQVDVIDGARNSFFYFFRAEGATEKSSDQLGRWGIGKQVFPRSSNAQTLFGFSVTDAHPEGFLLGSCILKYHEVSGRVFRPDGYFGSTLDVGEGQQISIPTQNRHLLESFRSDFNIRRSTGQNGLSVVVPWLDEGEEGSTGFNKESLLTAVFEGYFLPILEGKLEVELEDENTSVYINSKNFHQVLEELLNGASKDDERRNKSLRRTKALVELASSSMTESPLAFELAPCVAAKAIWSEEMLPEDTARAIRTALTDGRTVKVKATLTIRPKASEDIQDTFWCLIRKEDGLNERPCHIREDLMISSVSAARTSGFASIVRIDKGALAMLLGDSENPAHTEWLPSSQNFKDKYVLGGVVIKFVSDFPSELLRRVFASADQLDKDILRNWFFEAGPEKPDEEIEKQPKSESKEDGDSEDIKRIDIGPSQNAIRITPIKNGFTAVASQWDLTQGATVEISSAYETARGNPFKSYRSYDFDFADRSLKTEPSGCLIVEAKDNKLIIEAKAADFAVTVSGFDVNRDLVVRAKSIKSNEGS
jgi:hypothetical protein